MMRNRNFMEMLCAQFSQGKHLCVGLDSKYEKVPISVSLARSFREAMFEFNACIVDGTKDVAACYKPNFAFYEAKGPEGITALRDTVHYIHHVAPEAVVILDRKVGDIGNTNDGTAEMTFDYIGADAITVNPYFGKEALAPFLHRADKGVIVLCKTSNPGATEFQDLMVENPEYPHCVLRVLPLYQYVARRVTTDWNQNGNCGLVVGATYPSELKEVRDLAPDMPILCPGIGTQGGDLEATIAAADYKSFIINSSSGIIFADDPGAKARDLHENITACLQKGGVL